MEIKIMAPVEGQPLPPIEWNFEAVKQWVEDGLARYEGIVYDDSRIAEAKKDRATLNKLAQAIDGKRRDVKRLYLEPYEAFEVQAKELTGMIKDRVSGIDAQIKDYEAAKKAEKLERIKAECYEPMIGKLAELVPYDRLHEPRWLNATCSMNEIADAMARKVIDINAGLDALGCLDLPANIVEQCRATFLKDFNLAAALAEAENLKKQADSLKRWEAEKAAAEPAETRRADAEEMARVVYGTALYNSTEAQRAVMWCIINRVESPLYPDTVVEVCQQPSQWMGYSADTPVLGQLYDLAVEVLEAWENGGARNLPEGCLWFDWNGNEAITFRTAFDSSGNDWRVE